MHEKVQIILNNHSFLTRFLGQTKAFWFLSTQTRETYKLVQIIEKLSYEPYYEAMGESSGDET